MLFLRQLIPYVSNYSQAVRLPAEDWTAHVEAPTTSVTHNSAFTPEYAQWSLRQRNLRRSVGVPMNNIFW